MKIVYLVLVSCLFLTIGCKPSYHPLAIRRAYSVEELNQALRVGMTEKEVMQQLGGKATLSCEASANSTVWYYIFMGDPGTRSEYVKEVKICFVDGAVTSWVPITEKLDGAQELTHEYVPGKKLTGLGKQSFKVYVVNDALTNLVQIMNEKGYADASAITAPPDVELDCYASIDANAANGPVLILTMRMKDVALMNGFVSKNVEGIDTILVCQGKAVFSSRLFRLSETTKSLIIPLSDPTLLKPTK